MMDEEEFKMEDPRRQEDGDQILDLEEEKRDEFQIESAANYMSMRNRKIEKVAKAMGTVHNMYKTLNDIVDQQGVTLHRIQDNVHESKANTKSAKKETKKALMNEKSLKDKFAGGDCGVTCMVMWLIVVVIMFFVDMNLSQQKTPYY